MRHYKVADSSDIANYEYGYDYASNRTYQEDQVDTSEMDELYGYDTLHRLTSFERGERDVMVVWGRAKVCDGEIEAIQTAGAMWQT